MAHVMNYVHFCALLLLFRFDYQYPPGLLQPKKCRSFLWNHPAECGSVFHMIETNKLLLLQRQIRFAYHLEYTPFWDLIYSITL